MSQLISIPKIYLCYLFMGLMLFSSCQKDDNNQPSSKLSNLEKAKMTIQALHDGDTTTIQKYVSSQHFIQHSINHSDGLDGLLQSIKNGAFDQSSIKMMRNLENDNYVVLHSEYTEDSLKSAKFNVFRFEDGLIVEHWDNRQSMGPANASGRTMLDGHTEKSDTEKSASNRELVTKYLENVMLKLDFDSITNYIDSTQFIQHSPLMGDGYKSMVERMNALMSLGHSYHYEKIHQVISEGNFVFAMSGGTFGTDQKPTAFFDLYRLENDLIVEHWDVIESIPEDNSWPHNNGKF